MTTPSKPEWELPRAPTTAEVNALFAGNRLRLVMDHPDWDWHAMMREFDEPRPRTREEYDEDS